MQNWTYVGRANLGADPGVSLSGYTFNEVLAIPTVDFQVYSTSPYHSDELLLDYTRMAFYWIPELGNVQLARTFRHNLHKNHLLVTVLFTPTGVRTYKVRAVDRDTGGTINYNTSAHGYIDVYCR